MENNFADILYFGIAFEKFDILDFADDFLAGVRANYFNSGKEPQVNRSVHYVRNDEYSFIYTMKENTPLRWKVNKNGRIFQRAEAVDAETYCVSTYNISDKVYKKNYYNNSHIWLKTEYPDITGKFCEYVISPAVIDGQRLLIKIHYSSDSTVQSYLYPKNTAPDDGDYSVLAFTDKGVLFFNTVPNNKFITKTVIRDDAVDNLGGFNFDAVDFNLSRNLNTTFDITAAEYLTEDNGKPYYALTNSPFKNQNNLFEDNQEENNVKVYNKEVKKPDCVVESCGDSYSYYGSLDDFGKRSGYGRTVTPEGSTAYEGNYLDDKRNGFGTFYYKNGKVNFVGNWENNYRQGFGIGFRSTDGTSHIGKWNKNCPDGIGARFDKDGNFLFLGKYVDGKKQGKGISLDEDGNFIISEFKDDEVVSSRKLDDVL